VAALDNPQLAQLAFVTADIPASVRLYSEVFGFARSGGRCIWGDFLANVQGLPGDAQCVLWWMVGRQDFVQLEFFHHTKPAQRPAPADWRPSDLGWVRWGVATPDFDGAIARLRQFGIETITRSITHDGLRRVCFRDPNGFIVEVLEEGAALPGGIRETYHPFAPAVVYAAVSVRDLDAARRLYIETLGLIEDEVVLHTPGMEALWGLPGARRESFVARAGDAYIEVVRYDDPPGRPKPADHRASDQGMLNVAVAFRTREQFDELIERVRAAGYVLNAEPNPGSGFGSTYIQDGQGNTIEAFGCPREFDPYLGYVPEGVRPPAPAPAGR
jgi:catechol 2,3-dioxygenase-like lactoylglutathione lyase family enzyme